MFELRLAREIDRAQKDTPRQRDSQLQLCLATSLTRADLSRDLQISAVPVPEHPPRALTLAVRSREPPPENVTDVNHFRGRPRSGC
jgi:hypothetical protein